MEITYQIKLGPLLWDCGESLFLSVDRMDVAGTHITPRTIARELNRAMDKTSNLHGWQMEIIRNKSN